MKKILFYTLIILTFSGITIPVSAEDPVSPDIEYNLLAPLPCDPDRTPNCSPEGVLTSVSTKQDKKGGSDALGSYLNIIIRFFIGILAVLAMAMIVLGGLEYMTSELISSKESGKHKIRGAVLGLLLALGSYVLLNTINPALLKTDVNIEEEIIEVTVNETPPTADDYDSPDTPIPTGAVLDCAGGIVRINTRGGAFTLCSSIARNVQLMIEKAWEEDYLISGWGWRSTEKQMALRERNGCPNILTSPAEECRIPTAVPGTSRHESGLAVDLKCGGTTIQTRDNKCFLWLKENAESFGLKNLSSEPWHWSIDGR